MNLCEPRRRAGPFAGAAVFCVLVLVPPQSAVAQELEPGAYSISPVGVNIATASYTLSNGDLAFDSSSPIDEADAEIHTGVLAYVRTFALFGRSANLALIAPFADGRLEGRYLGQPAAVDRSGALDPRFRFAVNLFGAPAMSLQEFAGYRQKTNVGASLVVVAPLGKYDEQRLINLGTNRWAFKPEIGVSHATGNWTFELFAGVWLFDDNDEFLRVRTRKQDPILSTQSHVIYTFRPRLWASFDVNYYRGGETTIDDLANFDLQDNSRVGATLALPLSRRKTLKLHYSRGARTSIGADFDTVVLTFQHLWGGGL